MKGSIRQEILWWVSGVDKSIIRNSPNSEQNKHSGIGAIILFTALVAGVTGGFAIYSSSESKVLGIIFGFFWGAFILTVDRTLVSTFKKSSDNDKFGEFLRSLPRIVIALIFALLISRPAEVFLLKSQIDRYIQFTSSSDQQVAVEGFYNSLEIGEIDREIEEIKQELRELNSDYLSVETSPRSESLQNQFQSCQENLNDLRSQYRSYSGSISRVQNMRDDSRYYDEQRAYKVTSGPDSSKVLLYPPENGSYSLTTKTVVNDAGNARIDYLIRRRQYVNDRIRNLDCNTIESNRQTYINDRQNNIVVQIDRAQKAQEKLDTLISIRQIKLDSIRDETELIMKEANTGFIGRLVALERGKKSNTFLPGESSSIDSIDVVNKPIAVSGTDTIYHDYGAFPEEIDVSYLVQMIGVEEREDSIFNSMAKSTVNIKYVIEDGDIEVPEMGPDLGFSAGSGFSFKRNLLWWISNAIFLAFLVVELLPISVKVISDYGVYDEVVKLRDKKYIEDLKKNTE